MKLLYGVAGLLVMLGNVMLAQDPKEDMKDAGKSAGHAAKSTGRAAKHTARKVKHGTKKTVNRGANKVEEKTR